MKKHKKICLVQIYRRGQGENFPLREIFGMFGSEKNAREWVVKNGRQAIKNYANGHKHKDLFFVILEFLIDSPDNDWGVALCALDFDGAKTHFFSRYE